MWRAGQEIVRVHDSTYGATEPHPGPDGAHHHGLAWPRTRFAHFRSALSTAWVPTVYGASDDITAIAEVVLRGQDLHPASGRRVQLREAQLRTHVISTIAARRPLHLLDFSGAAITRGGPDAYHTTVAAAATLHHAHQDAEGLMWSSRQHPAGWACVLWVDEPGGRVRVRRGDLEVVAPPVPIVSRTGRNRVLAAAEALDVMVVAPGV